MAAKKTTKKAAKAVSKKASIPACVADAPYSVLDNPEQFAKDTQEALEAALGRRKGRVTDFSSQEDVRIEMLPVRSFLLQYAMHYYGIPKGMTEIIARDRTGKTSFIYNLFGGFLAAGSPCCILVCDGKKQDRAWAARCLSTDARLAQRMNQAIHVIVSSNLDEMFEETKAWIKILRDPKSSTYVPMSVPIILAVDPVGKLATKAQSAGDAIYDGREKEKETEVGAKGNNWDRAKWHHDWMPRMGLLQIQFNAHLIVASHQNDGNVAGGTMLPSFIPQWSAESKNRTKNGGQALNQNVGLQLILVDRGLYYSAGEPVARKIMLRPYKNSYGPEGREIFFAIKSEDYDDREGYIDSGLRWDYAEVEWMAEHGHFGMRQTGASRPQIRFSSEELGFTQLTLVEAAKALANVPQEKYAQLGAKLGIPGYVDVYEKIMAHLAPQAQGGSDA